MTALHMATRAKLTVELCKKYMTRDMLLKRLKLCEAEIRDLEKELEEYEMVG